jgi:aquaporin Z
MSRATRAIARKQQTAPTTLQRLSAEFLCTFWLVFAGCGSAVIAAAVPGVGIGYAGVALAFGLSVLTMVYAVGHISGGHFNPAVSVGLAVGGRFAWRHVPMYVLTQVVAAVVASAVLLAVANGISAFSVSDGFASNGYGDLSPGGYSLTSVVIVEVVLTAFFVYVILGATDTRAPKGFAPLTIGLALTLIHLVSIPVSNTSVNPARSTGPALFAGTEYLSQLWVFWLAPIAGGLIAGVTYAMLLGRGPGVPFEETTAA